MNSLLNRVPLDAAIMRFRILFTFTNVSSSNFPRSSSESWLNFSSTSFMERLTCDWDTPKTARQLILHNLCNHYGKTHITYTKWRHVCQVGQVKAKKIKKAFGNRHTKDNADRQKSGCLSIAKHASAVMFKKHPQTRDQHGVWENCDLLKSVNLWLHLRTTKVDCTIRSAQEHKC